MNDKKITVEMTDRQLAAILAADYCLRRSRQAQCKGLFIENIRDEKSRRIAFTDAIEVLDELLADIVPRMNREHAPKITLFGKITESPEILAKQFTEWIADQWNETPQCREAYIFDNMRKMTYFNELIKFLRTEVTDDD